MSCNLDCALLVVGIFTLIFLIIGLSTYLTGCHETLQPNCTLYYEAKVQITGHFTQSYECKECIDSKLICTYKPLIGTTCSNQCITYRQRL